MCLCYTIIFFNIINWYRKWNISYFFSITILNVLKQSWRRVVNGDWETSKTSNVFGFGCWLGLGKRGMHLLIQQPVACPLPCMVHAWGAGMEGCNVRGDGLHDLGLFHKTSKLLLHREMAEILHFMLPLKTVSSSVWVRLDENMLLVLYLLLQFVSLDFHTW